MVIIVTGASSGIGLATATLLANQGYTVYGLSRHTAQNVNFKSLSCDLTNFQQTKETFEKIYKQEKKIDILINNAGMGISGAVEHTSELDIRKQFELNLFALINACKCIVPFMRQNSKGKIINIGSVAGVMPIPFQTFYATSKAAVDMFSMSFGLEVKDFGIDVSVVLPGDTKTGFTASRVKNEVKDDSFYGSRIERSIKRMEQDEQNGKDPITVAKVILKLVRSKRPKARVTVGFTYKLLVFISRIVPRKFMLFVLKKMYG